MSFKYILLLITTSIQQDMIVDEQILYDSFFNLNENHNFIKIEENSLVDNGLTSYDYYTNIEKNFNCNFLGFTIFQIAIKIDDNENLKEILLKIKTYDLDSLYKKIIKKYEMPYSTSLSKYYIEKRGYQIPSNIKKDSLVNYYDNLQKPELEDFPELRDLVWFGLPMDNKINMLIKNKTNPEDIYSKKEVWIIFKKVI